MSTFGGTALHQYFETGYTGVANAAPELALFKMLEGLPFTQIVSIVSVFLIAIFFVTSADSGSLVMDTITAGGKLDAPVQQRVFWCLLAGLVAIALLVGGGSHDNTYVALCTDDGTEVLHARGKNTEVFQRVNWDASELVGRRVFLKG